MLASLAKLPLSLILLLAGALPLFGALFSQYALGFYPCHFCVLQRYPYLVVIAAGALLLVIPRGGLLARLLVALALYALLFTGLLGLIHTGIEQKFLAYAGGCSAALPVGASLEELRTAIMGAPLVSCSDALAVFFGLSMATWNALWAGTMMAAILYRARRTS